MLHDEAGVDEQSQVPRHPGLRLAEDLGEVCLLYTSDAADERSSVDLGGRRIIKKNTPVTEEGGKRIVH